MYREMGNGGAWGGTDINYVVITLPSHTQKRKVAINIILLCHYYRRHHYYRTIEQYRQSCRQRSAASRYSDRLVRVATSGGLAISALNARKADGACDRSAVINFRTGLLQPRFVPPRR